MPIALADCSCRLPLPFALTVCPYLCRWPLDLALAVDPWFWPLVLCPWFCAANQGLRRPGSVARFCKRTLGSGQLRTLVSVWLVAANTGAPGPCSQAADGAKRVIALRLVAEMTQGGAAGRRGLRAVAGRLLMNSAPAPVDSALPGALACLLLATGPAENSVRSRSDDFNLWCYFTKRRETTMPSIFRA